LASDSSFFIFMFGIPTGDLNPIYNVPMLGTHKSSHDNPLPAINRNFTESYNRKLESKPRSR